jgi:two-component system, cell cycle sensor histidine kinase and response regulator CckA
MELIRTLIAALDGPDAETCLEQAIRALGEHGLAEPASAGTPWLELQRGGPTLTLRASPNAKLPDAALASQVEQLLGAALARAAERGEYRRVCERMNMLSEASFEGIMLHDGGVLVDCNQRLREMLGFGRDEPLGSDMMQRCVAPEDLAAAAERIRNRVEGEFPVTLVRKDGTRFRAEFCTKQTKLGDRPYRVVALRDVTERARTAALLRESEQRLRQILEATFDVVVMSRDGIILETGGRTEEFFGVPAQHLVGRPILEFVAPSSRDVVAQRTKQNFVGTYESVAIGANGQFVPIEVISVTSTLNGEPVRAAGIRDLRAARRLEQDRRQLELQIERSQRLQGLGALAGGVAHDFNNLLVGVMGSAELLLDRLQDPEDRAIAETIRVTGERAAGLTKQLLAYAGRRELVAPEPVDLEVMWHELRGLLDATLSKKAEIEYHLAPNSVVLGERAALMQVMMNLLQNASDALEGQPGTIRVSTERVREPDARWDDALGASVRPGDWVLVKVRDSGCGMDEATKRRIFEPFFTTKPRGHGLGLGSCLGIVAAHGGAISVESTPKHGSTFSLLLPATAARAEHAPVRPSSAPRACRILVVDDEELVRTHLRRLLERRGFHVLDVADGKAAIAAVKRTRPDVVLLDLSMRELDGVDVVRRLRAEGSHVPIVLCSGDLEYASDRGLESGLVQSILQKPFSTEELIQAIERARGNGVSVRP